MALIEEGCSRILGVRECRIALDAGRCKWIFGVSGCLVSEGIG